MVGAMRLSLSDMELAAQEMKEEHHKFLLEQKKQHEKMVEHKDQALREKEKAHQDMQLTMQMVVRIKTALSRHRLKRHIKSHSSGLLRLVKEKAVKHAALMQETEEAHGKRVKEKEEELREKEAAHAKTVQEKEEGHLKSMQEKEEAHAKTVQEKEEGHLKSMQEKEEAHAKTVHEKEQELREKEEAHAKTVLEKEQGHLKSMQEKEEAHAKTMLDKDQEHQNDKASTLASEQEISKIQFKQYEVVKTKLEDDLSTTQEQLVRTKSDANLSLQMVVRVKTVLSRMRLKKKIKEHSTGLLGMIRTMKEDYKTLQQLLATVRDDKAQQQEQDGTLVLHCLATVLFWQLYCFGNCIVLATVLFWQLYCFGNCIVWHLYF
jgi:hypothetical protein